LVFLIHTELRCTVNHTSDVQAKLNALTDVQISGFITRILETSTHLPVVCRTTFYMTQ